MICGAGIFAAYQNYKNNNQGWAVVFGIIALIFNPLIPLYIYDKFAWLVIDLVAGLLFLFNSKKMENI